MINREYIKQRIDIFAGKVINPNSDIQVKEVLRALEIKLPQKNSLDDSLNASNDEHEMVKLIIQYRKLS